MSAFCTFPLFVVVVVVFIISLFEAYLHLQISYSLSSRLYTYWIHYCINLAKVILNSTQQFIFFFLCMNYKFCHFFKNLILILNVLITLHPALSHTHTHTHTHKLADCCQGQPEGSLSIATTSRCSRGCYSFLWIAPLTLDTYLIMLSVKQGGIKYHFFEFLVWLKLGHYIIQ